MSVSCDSYANVSHDVVHKMAAQYETQSFDIFHRDHLQQRNKQNKKIVSIWLFFDAS